MDSMIDFRAECRSILRKANWPGSTPKKTKCMEIKNADKSKRQLEALYLQPSSRRQKYWTMGPEQYKAKFRRKEK